MLKNAGLKGSTLSDHCMTTFTISKQFSATQHFIIRVLGSMEGYAKSMHVYCCALITFWPDLHDFFLDLNFFFCLNISTCCTFICLYKSAVCSDGTITIFAD